MLIVNRDRDQIIQKRKPLLAVPNIRTSSYSGERYICSYNIYHGTEFLGDYDTLEAALTEMEKINRCKDEIYFIGGYSGDPKILRKLEAELRRLMDDA